MEIGTVEVYGKSSENSPNQYNGNYSVSNTLCRRYQMPSKILPNYGRCGLCNGGVLIITAPWNKFWIIQCDKKIQLLQNIMLLNIK